MPDDHSKHLSCHFRERYYDSCISVYCDICFVAEDVITNETNAEIVFRLGGVLMSNHDLVISHLYNECKILLSLYTKHTDALISLDELVAQQKKEPIPLCSSSMLEIGSKIFYYLDNFVVKGSNVAGSYNKDYLRFLVYICNNIKSGYTTLKKCCSVLHVDAVDLTTNYKSKSSKRRIVKFKGTQVVPNNLQLNNNNQFGLLNVLQEVFGKSLFNTNAKYTSGGVGFCM